jgi:hypothetical protein
MSKFYKNIAMKCLAASMLAAPAISAQTLQSGYFDDNYQFRYRANPALGNNERCFVAMPALGNLNVATQGNLALDNVLYNINGKTTTFLNPEVDAASFLGNLKEKNRIGLSLNETLIAVGWKSWGGFNTITVGARAEVSAYLPKDLFRLAKEGASNQAYDIGQLGATAQAWGEIALNHSHKINDKWRVGATLKLLVGLGNVDAKFNNATLTLGQDTWSASVDAQLNTSIKNLTYKTDYNENTRRNYVSGMDCDNFGIGGFGGAVDLGVAFNPTPDWELSAAVVDLGFINWKNNMLATTDGRQTVVTDQYSFNVDDDTSFDKFKDDLSMLYQLSDAGDQGTRTTMLGTTVNIGARFNLPTYRRLNFGLLNTTRVQGAYSWTNFRLSADIQPVNWLSGGVNVGYGTFGTSFGWIFNIKAPGFNLYIASDCTPMKLAKQGAPLKTNANVNFGITFPF